MVWGIYKKIRISKQLTYRLDGEREIKMTSKEMERVILKETYEAWERLQRYKQYPGAEELAATARAKWCALDDLCDRLEIEREYKLIK